MFKINLKKLELAFYRLRVTEYYEESKENYKTPRTEPKLDFGLFNKQALEHVHVHLQVYSTSCFYVYWEFI